MMMAMLPPVPVSQCGDRDECRGRDTRDRGEDKPSHP